MHQRSPLNLQRHQELSPYEFPPNMSHHVVVRDDQEPALIFANGLACSRELVGQLLEWSPKVIALDGAFDRLADWRIKVDVVLGDMDSLNQGALGTRLDGRGTSESEHREGAQAYLSHRQDGVHWVYAPDQEYTDLEKALSWAYEQGHRAAHVLWANGLDADHFIGNLHALAAVPRDFAVTMIQDQSRIFRLPNQFSKGYIAGTRLSLWPFPTAYRVRTENLVYALHSEDLHLGKRIGIRNQVERTAIVRIEHQEGCLMLQEPLSTNI
ncbi:MAG: thiamine pyrophosphokinase [Bacteroidetes bacterium]|nr:thiamine pyrophosphokinase [Bacteroidota bacterium]